MTDPRPFFKLHNGFPEHPKTLSLSDKAFRHLIELWCYCHRARTDGFVHSAQFRRTTTLKTRTELVEIGFVILDTDGAWMRDYLEHQESRSDIEIRSITRAEAGRKGGKAKAAGLAKS
jgi:hypothetical protein